MALNTDFSERVADMIATTTHTSPSQHNSSVIDNNLFGFSIAVKRAYIYKHTNLINAVIKILLI